MFSTRVPEPVVVGGSRSLLFAFRCLRPFRTPGRKPLPETCGSASDHGLTSGFA